MITDALVGAVLGLLGAIIGALPDMPEPPAAISGFWGVFVAAHAILPIDDLQAFGPTFLATLGLLVVVRVVRFFLPGG